MTVSPEHGKRYNTRGGHIVGPMNVPPIGDWEHVVVASFGRLGWCKDGVYLPNANPDGLDLISEYIEPTAEPAWIEWHGGECPIKSDKTRGQWRHSTGMESQVFLMKNMNWPKTKSGHTIIAYRITENHEPTEPAPIDMSQNRVQWELLTAAEKAEFRAWDSQYITYFHRILLAWHKYDPGDGFRDAGVYRTIYQPVITETVHGVEIDGHTVTINITRHDGKPISGTVEV